MRGSLWRVASEQLRPATADESRGVEIVNRFLSDMKTDLQSPHGPKRYLDITREGAPRFPRNDSTEPAEEGDSDEDDETRTPMTPVSRLSEHDQATSEIQSETTENFPPETFRGGVALQDTVRGVEQPENARILMNTHRILRTRRRSSLFHHSRQPTRQRQELRDEATTSYTM